MKLTMTILVVALFWGCTRHSDPEVDRSTVARVWNEQLLSLIRVDFARPPVHARNLFHLSAAMFDAWAVFDGKATPYLLGRNVNGFMCAFNGFQSRSDLNAARREAISYAAYRVLSHRFSANASARANALALVQLPATLEALGYSPAVTTTDYAGGSAAALGNYIAQCIVAYGLQDGSNELGNNQNRFYTPINNALDPRLPGNPFIKDPNRWQPLLLDGFVDQSGNVIPGRENPFLGAEWGLTQPFALSGNDRSRFVRDGAEYVVYLDPGRPPQSSPDGGGTTAAYAWNFSLVSVWSSHLDPKDGVMWDISPAARGGPQVLPATPGEYSNFYKLIDGGDSSSGHSVNPFTGQPYETQIVPRGDFTRVVAEFWADGPDSETPPGHWFKLFNQISDHPALAKRVGGKGERVDNLQWDIKGYFALGGAMHDSAIGAWSIKGWYDSVRPLSALRFMAAQGQSSDPALEAYSPRGIKLVPGLIELVNLGDPLAGVAGQNKGKIKVLAWRGPSFVDDPKAGNAGVGWILAENWWPYQRPNFVTPPFGGFISGHSTFSRAAAEVVTLLTGDEYFPGGLGEHHVNKNAYLVFERGPSVDLTLQWATYRDAAAQSSLSRIWGGIHPPVDDVAGRRIGEYIGVSAFALAERHFGGL